MAVLPVVEAGHFCFAVLGGGLWNPRYIQTHPDRMFWMQTSTYYLHMRTLHVAAKNVYVCVFVNGRTRTPRTSVHSMTRHSMMILGP